MASCDSSLSLASEFATVDRNDWLARVGDIDALRSPTYDGLTIEPLYDLDDAVPWAAIGSPGAAPFTRGRGAAGTRATPWDVRQRVDAADPRIRAVTELERGATSVLLDARASPTIDDELFERVLEGVHLELAPVVIDAGPRWAEAADVLSRLWERRGGSDHAVSGSLGADPYGEWASDRVGVDLDAQIAAFGTWAARLSRWPAVRLATVDATRFHDAGSSDAQELGYGVAVLVATLRHLVDDTGLDVDAAFGRLELRLAATVDQFATVAKIRAARRLVARVAEIAGSPDAARKLPLHATTSRAMSTRYDPAVNMLRTTVACFAAGVAGADSVTVEPYDRHLGSGATELGRRLARNTQSVLSMESHIARVLDPAGGSWYVERRTDELARAAWDCFQQVESAGGFRAAVETGLVHGCIAATRAARDVDVDHRRMAITGVSEFPNVAEPPPPPSAPPSEPPDGTGLGRHRWAERFETLRQRVDAAAAATGARPRVFAATIGSAAESSARLSFASNLFAVAGIDTVSGPAGEFAASGATVACLCGNDAGYRDSGVATATELRAADATKLYLAGRPRDVLDPLVAAGVSDVIHAGCDARTVLSDLLEHLAIP